MDGDFIIFNCASGSTHLIKPFAKKILSILESQPSSTSEIVGRIAQEAQLEPDEEILHRVDAVLNTLDYLGLIESYLSEDLAANVD